MTISWTATGAMLSGWGSLAGAAAVAYAAFKAADTVEKWKSRKLTERKFEHAEAVLAATFRVKDALEIMRSPLISGVELKAAEKELEDQDGWANQTEDDRNRFTIAQARIMRIRSTEDDWEALQQTMPLAKALFDQDLEEAIGELHRQRWIFRTYVDAAADDRGEDQDWSREIRANLHESRGRLGDDEISRAVADNVATIERICLPVLRS